MSGHSKSTASQHTRHESLSRIFVYQLFKVASSYQAMRDYCVFQAISQSALLHFDGRNVFDTVAL